MAINFPTSPVLNQEYTFGTKTWVWNGIAWNLKKDEPIVILDLIKTVDGTGSGLDSDLLDGNHSSAFYSATNPSGYTSNTGTVTSVGGTGSYGGLTLSGTVTTSGNLTLGGTPTGTWPIAVSGNAATATALQTARTINGVSFNGTANINIATNLIVLNRSAVSVNVAIANALLPIVNRAGSTINVAVS